VTGIWPVQTSADTLTIEDFTVFQLFYASGATAYTYCGTVSSSSIVLRPIRKRKTLEKLNLNFAMSLRPRKITREQLKEFSEHFMLSTFTRHGHILIFVKIG